MAVYSAKNRFIIGHRGGLSRKLSAAWSIGREVLNLVRLELLVGIAFLSSACAFFDNHAAKKPASTGLIATPASYYSTGKAKYLATKYKENLDRIVERIAGNARTSALQFANNISSVGGIGFFTHSATKTPDERYLEIVLATPETFESSLDISAKVDVLFSRYGTELLRILGSDAEIYNDKEMSGYGLNLTWRNMAAEPAGNRVTLARAIVYFPKERVLSFLRNEINQNELLAEAVIFAVDEDGPFNLVSYKPQTLRPELRPTIREDDLTSSPVAANRPPAQSARVEESKAEKQKAGQFIEAAKRDETLRAAAPKPNLKENKAEAEKAAVSEQKSAMKPAQRNVPNPPSRPMDVAKPKNDPRAVSAANTQASKAEAKSVDRVQGETRADVANAVKAAPEKPVKSVATPATANENTETEEAVSKMPPAAMPQMLEPAEKPPAAISPVTEPTRGAAIVVAEASRASVSPLQTEIKSTGEPKESGSPKLAPMEAAIEGENQEGKVSTPTAALMSKPEPRRVAPAQSGTTTATLEPQSGVAPTKQAETTKEAQQQAPASRPPARLPVEEKAGKSQPNITPATEPAGSLPANLETKIRQERSPTSTVKGSTFDARQEPVKAVAVPGGGKTEMTPVETKSAAPPNRAKPQTVSQESSNNEQLALNKPKESRVEKIAPAKPVAGAFPPESIQPSPMPELSRVTPAPRVPPPSETKTETPALASKETEPNVEKPSGEQVALLSKPPEPPLEKKAALLPLPQKALEGFVIQLAFSDKEKARHWAEAMQRRGYAVSLTEVGAEGPLRVRLGNFAAREEAERQLLSLKQNGLSGIIINMPQAYRPEARSSVP